MTQNKSKTIKIPTKPFKFYKISQIHFLNTRQVCMYIKKLHQIIRQQQACLTKFKKKTKKNDTKTEKNQDDKEIVDPNPLVVNEEEERDKKVSNFLDDIKSAATEGFIQQMGMIYEPTSGMYYHPTTGYYYNAEYNLYYDGNTGTYLTYNEQTFAYEFYSKVDTVDLIKSDQSSSDKVHDSPCDNDINSLLNNFSQLNINQMRANALDKRDRKRRDRRSDSESLDEFGRSKIRRAEKDDRSGRRQRKRSRSRSSSLDKRNRRRHHRSRDRHRKSISDDSDEERCRSRKKNIRKSRSPRRKSNKREKKSPDRKKRREKKSRTPSSVEEGEISGASSSSARDSSNERRHWRKKASGDHEEEQFRRKKDIAAKYPPSLRLIILETDINQDKLKIGSLFIIPYTGGSLGREGSHDIIIPDVNVSKTHLRFTYNKDKDRYECSDVGSRNGTILNGTRMAENKEKPLPHDSVIELNKTKILCHIHEGHTTCERCEPGIIQKTREASSAPSSVVMEVISHKAALKQLQKRYGLENEKYIEDPKDIGTSSGYKDRADTRRKTVGSSHHTEKTVTASLDTSISSDNKGFKMLSKLGWTEGTKLGKSDGGILEPIPIVSNEGTKGLGCDEPRIMPSIKIGSKKIFRQQRKAAILAKTQERFAMSRTSTATDIETLNFYSDSD